MIGNSTHGFNLENRKIFTGVLALFMMVMAFTIGAPMKEVRAASPGMTLALPAMPSTFDPIEGARSGGMVWDSVVEPLINYDATTLVPVSTGLVTSWIHKNATTWIFTLRPSITFTNGEKADAAAAVFSILQNTATKDPKAILAGYFAPVTSATVVDSTTFKVVTSSPLNDLPLLLTTVYMLPPTAYAAGSSRDFSNHLIGTGPYMFSSAVSGVSYTVVPNPDCWDGAGKVSSLTFIWQTDPTTRLGLVQSGTAQVSFDEPPSSVVGLTGVTVVKTPVARSNDAFLVSQVAPFDNASIRKAVAETIDRHAIATGIFKGQVVEQKSLLTVNPTVQKITAVKLNIADAKAIVKKYKGDKSFLLSYPIGLLPDIDLVAQAIASQLTKIGLKPILTPVTYGALVGAIIGGTQTGLYIMSVVPNAPTPAFLTQGFLTSNSITQNCNDPRFDTEQATALASSDAAAEKIWQLMDKQAVLEDHCYVPLYSTTKMDVMATNVTGWKLTPVNRYTYFTLSYK